MSEFDIMPYRAAGGQHCQVGSGSIASAASFLKGEPVELDTSGDLIESTDTPSAAGGVAINSAVIGIALSGAEATAVTFASDATRATAQSENVQLQYAIINRGDEFIIGTDSTNRRFTKDNDTTMDEIPVVGDLGSPCALRTSGGVWGISVNASATALDFRLIGLLDINGQNIDVSGGTVVNMIIRCEV